jgi:molybdopterin synthase catalytic subunit
MRVVISTYAFEPGQELASFARGGEAGAVASFVGYCRAEGGAVERLELEHYPRFTEAVIKRLAEAAFQRHGLIDLLVIHRVGAIAAGEAIVLVAASSAHRLNALTAVSEIMDYLKTEAPIWKKEVGADRVRWVEPSVADRQAAARWAKN